ncbi:MAG: 50S ribosomal protein L11 methyltransferase [Pseudomonadota bacterium]
MPKTGWLQFTFTLTGEAVAAAQVLLESLNALSVTLADAGDEALLEPSPGSVPLWRQIRVVGLFDGACDPVGFRQALLASLPETVTMTLQQEWIPDQAWERVWLQDFHPQRFGRRLWVCPTGQQPPEASDDAVILTLDPGLAFGTGAHPTTALCLNWLDGLDLHGRAVLDYGCGSGILAIAALKLGATMALGIDHDPQALLASRQNALVNGVEARLQVAAPDEAPSGCFDGVVANILANPLIELAPLLIERLTPGGVLGLSGILADQALEVAAAYTPAVVWGQPVFSQGWALLGGFKL